MTHAPITSLKRNLGFGLLEIMIAVVIVGILAAIAYPSYIEYIKNGHETEAKGQMMELAAELEALKAKSFSYAGASISALAPRLDSNENYSATLSLESSNQAYTITATPSSSLMSGRPALTLSSDGTTTRGSSTPWD